MYVLLNTDFIRLYKTCLNLKNTQDYRLRLQKRIWNLYAIELITVLQIFTLCSEAHTREF